MNETKYFVKFCNGPLDGTVFPINEFVDKLVIQYSNGRTLRYECGMIDGRLDAKNEIVECCMQETMLDEEFDSELKQDEA